MKDTFVYRPLATTTSLKKAKKTYAITIAIVGMIVLCLFGTMVISNHPEEGTEFLQVNHLVMSNDTKWSWKCAQSPSPDPVLLPTDHLNRTRYGATPADIKNNCWAWNCYPGQVCNTNNTIFVGLYDLSLPVMYNKLVFKDGDVGEILYA